MMRCLLFFCLFTQFSFAQIDDSIVSVIQKGGADRFNITAKLDFTGLINPFKNSTAVVSDFRLNQKLSLEGTLGGYFHSSVSSNVKGETYLGLKTAVGLKHWINPPRFPSMYWGFLIGGNYIVNKTYRDIIRQNQFIEIDLVKRKILSGSLAVRFGFQWHLGEQKRFIIDQFWGLGLMVYRLNIVTPENAGIQRRFNDFFSFELSENESTYPHGYLLGINVGYVIK